MQVIMKWNNDTHEWEMTDSHGYAVYEFKNCRNVNAVFPKLNKNKENWYELEGKLIEWKPYK